MNIVEHNIAEHVKSEMKKMSKVKWQNNWETDPPLSQRRWNVSSLRPKEKPNEEQGGFAQMAS